MRRKIMLLSLLFLLGICSSCATEQTSKSSTTETVNKETHQTDANTSEDSGEMIGSEAKDDTTSGKVEETDEEETEKDRETKQNPNSDVAQNREEQSANERKLAPNEKSPANDQRKPTQANKVETKKEIKSETIKFDTTKQKDPNLEKGKTKVIQKGKNGKINITYEVTYRDGKKVAMQEVAREIVTKPRDEIVAIGTKENPKKQQASGNSAIEDEIIRLINNERQKHGLSPLQKNGTVTQIARNHSLLMANKFNETNNISIWHSDLNRVFSSGVSATMVAENVAWVQPPSASQAVQGWMNSPGHRQNILTADFTHTGVGYAEMNGVGFYTQLFYK